MTSFSITRTPHHDGGILLTGGQASVLIRRPTEKVMVLAICGAATRDVGAPMFEEIVAAMKPDTPISLFVDLQQAMGASVAVETWVRFLTEHQRSIARIYVLAISKATTLTANVIDHFTRRDGLFEIFSEPQAWHDKLATAIATERPALP